jgi:O-antigen/teichoic acid export membrane protein
VAWATVGTVFNQGSTLASNVAIANLLGRSTFGEYAIVLATVQATAALGSMGVGYTATRYLAEWRHRDAARAGRLLGLFSRLSWGAGGAAVVALAAASVGLAGGVLRTPTLGPALLLAAAAALFAVRNGFLMGALAGLEAFRRLGVAGVLAGTAYLALTAAGAWAGAVRGAAMGLLVSAAIQCAILSLALAAERRAQALPRAAAGMREEREILLRFALPGALSGLTTVPVLWAVQALLARSPRGFDDVGVYAAGLNLLAMVLFVPTVLNGVAMVWINRERAQQGDHGYWRALRANLRATALLAGLALLVTALGGRWLLGLYGQDFRVGYGALVLLLAAAVPEALTVALNQSLQTRERMWQALVAINVPRDLVILLGAWLLIPHLGAVGAAGAYLAGRTVGLAAVAGVVRRDFTHAAGSAA